MDLLSGEKLYTLIYHEVQQIYNLKIDQKFLVDLIDLKNKKRESSKFILYLEGVERMLSKIADSDERIEGMLKRVRHRLQEQKDTTHTKIIKIYKQHLKVPLLNFFTILGKLKALHKIVKVKGQTIKEIASMFNS